MLLSSKRSQVVEEARSFVNTPFHHQGRTKGVGVDCAGLIVLVGRGCGFKIEDAEPLNYSRYPFWSLRLLDALHKNLRPISLVEAREGSVVWFWIARPTLGQHLGILTSDGRMIHAWEQAGKVIESSYGPYWRERELEAFDFPFVEELE